MLRDLKFRSVSASSFNDIPTSFFPEASCRSCTYWIEEGGPQSTRSEATKKQWLAKVNKSFGECIKLAYFHDEVTAWAMYAPPSFLPRVSSYPTKASNDAVFIACLTVSPDNRGKGVGSATLDEVLTSLKTRGLKLVETIARKGSANNPSGPIELYLKNGFRIWRDHNEYPLLRMETR
jgi:GNAT superfamily N-acetyltransferase